MKKCSNCNKEKSLEQFFKDKTTKDKHTYCCKECMMERAKMNRIKRHDKYPWERVLINIKSRCTNPNNKSYKTYHVRKCLITIEEIKKLWFRDKAYNMKRPSIDRIDNDGHYEFKNCRFIEMEENRIRNKKKSILQFDLNGHFIKEWESLSEAHKKLNINLGNIMRVLKGERNMAGNYIWKYKNE